MKRLASTCEFETLRDSIIKEGIVLGVRDIHVKDRLLRENALTLERAIEIYKASQISRQQLKELDAKSNITVHAVETHKPQKKDQLVTNCSFCSSSHQYGKCPVLRMVKYAINAKEKTILRKHVGKPFTPQHQKLQQLSNQVEPPHLMMLDSMIIE